MKKIILAVAVLMMAIPLSSALQLQNANVNSINKTLTPGEKNHVANIQLQYDEPVTFQNIGSNFGITAEPRSISSSLATLDIQLNLNPSSDFPPSNGLQQGDIQVQVSSQNNANTSIDTVTVPYRVIEYNNWEVSPGNISNNFSAGTNKNIFAELEITQKGNKRNTKINYSANGNASKLFAPESGSFELYHTQNETLSFDTKIPNDQKFGYYDGNITLESADNRTNTIPIETNVSDDLAPTISSTKFPDVQASQPTQLEAVVSDNIGVKEVYAEVNRTIKKDFGGNQTQETEVVADRINLTSGFSDAYTAKLDKTGKVGEYTVRLFAVDESGNVVNTTESFKVEKLDSVDVLNENFRLQAVEVETKTSQQIINVDKDTPVQLKLGFFTHDNRNSSITIGVKKQGQTASDPLDITQDEPVLTIEEEGKYVLEVSSNAEEAYRGRIETSYKDVPSENAETVPDILFEGVIVDADYPSPRNWSVGNFRGHIGFESTDRTVKEQIVFRGTAPAKRCEGFGSWARCIPDLTFGEYQDIEDERDEWKKKAKRRFWMAVGSLGFTIFFILAYWRKENLEGDIRGYISVKY